MAKRIPKPFIDELTARTDLLALLSSRITFTKKSGSNPRLHAATAATPS